MVPVVREALLAFGFIDASESSIVAALDRFGSVAVVVGGASESLEGTAKRPRLVLKSRSGFVRVAKENDAHLCPVFSFNELSLLPQRRFSSPTWRAFVDKFKRATGFVPIVPKALTLKRIEVTTVVGRPISPEELSSLSVSQAHDVYLERLTELYAKHASKHGYADEIDFV
jgi:hypothetical protein